MAIRSCDHGHSTPLEMFDHLDDSKSMTGRHKCAVCAYIKGYERGLIFAAIPSERSESCHAGKIAPANMIDDLPESKAVPGQHKCPVCVYHFGFARGRRDATPKIARRSRVLAL
jgi:hypothetical protein